MKLAFIGIGLMGAPMARRLLEAGHDLALWNRSAAKLGHLVQRGARAAASPADAAQGAAIVMLCVTDAAAVEAVVFGAGGVAEAIGRDALLVDFSSISPEATRRLAERLERERGSRWIDAPVSGGVPGAEQGRLVIMAGGDAADIERARPVLDSLAAAVTAMGPVGAGQTTKLCNQMIVGGNLVIIAEALKLAQQAGVDAARLPDCLKGGFADSLPLQIFGRRMASGRWDPPLAAAAILLKDLDTACDLARQTTTPVPMTSLASALFRLLKAQGRGDEDPAALITLLG
ncbi:MAG TPA: NAD(P)-dependent oxidoreductase [Stellaceae bacterium]|jgi:3-hydroxyisobutyrate dehydrogenase|nr:NAD(P)-dependent oxidoreductase [Stellaceae bacterium]